MRKGHQPEHDLRKESLKRSNRETRKPVLNPLRHHALHAGTAGFVILGQHLAFLMREGHEVHAVERQIEIEAHHAVDHEVMQAMLEVSRVLTPEQRVQLAEKLKQRGDAMQRQLRDRKGG